MLSCVCLYFCYADVIKQINAVVENNIGVCVAVQVFSRLRSVSQLISVSQLLIINTPPIIQSNKLTPARQQLLLCHIPA